MKRWTPWALKLLLILTLAACDDTAGDEQGADTAADVGAETGDDVVADTAEDTAEDTALGDTADDSTAGDTGADTPEVEEVVERGPVTFDTSPSESARVGVLYSYDADASQENAQPEDTISFVLETAPTGMTVDADSGLVEWTPTSAQVGDHDVVLTASGGGGEFAQQSWTITVEPGFAITGLMPAAGTARGGETITITGTFPESGVTVKFGSLPPASSTQIDATTLEVVTPSAVAGTYPVTLIENGVDGQTFRPGFTFLPEMIQTDASAVERFANLNIVVAGLDDRNLETNLLEVGSVADTVRRLPAATEDQGELSYSLGISNSEAEIVTGPISVLVNGLRSPWRSLTISDATQPPVLNVTSFQANGVTELELSGSGFGGQVAYDGSSAFDLSAPDALYVMFAGAAAPAQVQSINTEGTVVTVTLPNDARTGPVTLYGPDPDSGNPLVPQKSKVIVEIPGTDAVLDSTGFTPEGGLRRSAVVIDGSGFDENTTITIQDLEAPLLSVEPQRVVAAIPATAAFGPAEIVLSNGTDTISAGIFSVTTDYDVLAGGGEPISDIGDGLGSLEVTASPGYVTTDSANNILFSDGPRVRMMNTTDASLTAYGVTIAPGVVDTVANSFSSVGELDLDAPGVTAIAVHPTTEDIYFAAGARIYQVRRSDGRRIDYAGTGTVGNSGNGGYRLNANLSGITDLQFTTQASRVGTFLVIADNSNGDVRAINTTGTPESLWGVTINSEAIDRIVRTGQANPMGVSLNENDDLYISRFRQLVYVPIDRNLDTDPAWTVLAGAGAINPDIEGCPALDINLGTNDGVAYNPTNGEVYIGSRSGVIRRFYNDADLGQDCLQVVAGSWAEGEPIARIGYGGDNGPALDASIALFARPFVDRNGDLLIPADGRVRRVTINDDGTPGNIQTIIGTGPNLPTDGTSALDLRSTPQFLVNDPTRDRYIYHANGVVWGHNTSDDTLVRIAGTGVSGNTVRARAVDSDLGTLRGMALDGDDLYILETVIPRISKVDLTTGTLTVVAGDGVTATAEEQALTGPAIDARVGINTGLPDAVIGPDGGLYFADSTRIRVINITDAAIDSFGVTVAPGDIAEVPGSYPGNTASIIFDASGDLLFTNRSNNLLYRKSASSADSYAVTAITAGRGRYGFNGPRTLDRFRFNRPAGMSFRANGDLILGGDFGHTLTLVQAQSDGTIGPDSEAITIFGNGSNTNLEPRLHALATGARFTRSSVIDDNSIVFTGGGRIIRITP